MLASNMSAKWHQADKALCMTLPSKMPINARTNANNEIAIALMSHPLQSTPYRSENPRFIMPVAAKAVIRQPWASARDRWLHGLGDLRTTMYCPIVVVSSSIRCRFSQV